MKETRIRCINCGWEDNNEFAWQCTCKYIWNAFQTDCNCPICNTSWDYIQCPSCGMPQNKNTYHYSGNKLPANPSKTTNEPYLGVDICITSFEYQLILQAWKWKLAYEESLKSNRLYEFTNEKKLGNVNLSSINEGLTQIIHGKGQTIDAPLYCASILDFKGLLKSLSIKIIECKSNYMLIEKQLNVEMYSIESALKKGTFTIYVSYPIENTGIN